MAAAGVVAHAGEINGYDIAVKATLAERPAHWDAVLTLKHTTAGGVTKTRQGSASMKVSSSDNPMRLFKFSAPADIKGTVLLTHEKSVGDDDMWLHLPVLGKTRRIVSSNKKSSFVGTQFAFTDLATPKPQDYTHKVLKQETLDALPCYVLESVPKNESILDQVGYSKIVSWVSTHTFLTIKMEYFDTSGKLLKEQRVRGFVQVSSNPDRWIGSTRSMRNMQNLESSELMLENINAKGSGDEARFNPSTLGL